MQSRTEIINLITLAQSGDEKSKEILIELNSPLVKSIVKRYLNKYVEYDDLYQLGQLGLVKAINNFNCEFDVHFSTYAVPMIAGEIKRFLRDDGSVKVSRSVKTLNKELQHFIDEYKAENKTSPSIEMLAEKFSVEPSEIVFALDSNKKPLSLYQPLEKGERGNELLDRISDESNDDATLSKIVLKNEIKKLPLRDRQIILLRFYRDMTQSEVAKLLNVSQVQVSRLESKILNNLKQKIE